MSYNVRVYTYTNGQQFRFYRKSIGNDKDKKIMEKEVNEKNDKKEFSLADNEIKRNSADSAHSDYVSKNRTKQKLFELARSNKWEWFITLTFDRAKVDSSNYQELTKIVSKWLNNIRNRSCNELKYLLVPELHKDGKHYHFHGLLANADNLNFIDSGIMKNNKIVYNMEKWKYGFSTATKVADYNRVCSYIAKYITKDLLEETKGKKRYWASRNLEKPLVEDYAMTNDEIEQWKMEVLNMASHVKTQDIEIIGQSVTYVEVPFYEEL